MYTSRTARREVKERLAKDSRCCSVWPPRRTVKPAGSGSRPNFASSSSEIEPRSRPTALAAMRTRRCWYFRSISTGPADCLMSAIVDRRTGRPSSVVTKIRPRSSGVRRAEVVAEDLDLERRVGPEVDGPGHQAARDEAIRRAGKLPGEAGPERGDDLPVAPLALVRGRKVDLHTGAVRARVAGEDRRRPLRDADVRNDRDQLLCPQLRLDDRLHRLDDPFRLLDPRAHRRLGRDQLQGQEWRHGARDEEGGKERDRDRERERDEEQFDLTLEEHRRHEDDDRRDGRGEDRHRHLTRGVEDGRTPRRARDVQVSIDVLELDDRVVHEPADGEGEAAQGEDVERLAQEVHTDE